MAEYRYDGSNRRILKTVTNKGDLNGTTRFLWGSSAGSEQAAAWQCLEERDSGGDLVARYTYATGYIDAVAVQERDLNGDDDFADDDEVVYYHSNTLYSVYALSDADENVVERMRYDAYGAATVLDSDFSSDADGASDVENPYTFTARRWDAESGLMQYRNRYYHPALGRFVGRDPARYVDGYPLYLYVADCPVGFWDPFGLELRLYTKGTETFPIGRHAYVWSTNLHQGAQMSGSLGSGKDDSRIEGDWAKENDWGPYSGDGDGKKGHPYRLIETPDGMTDKEFEEAFLDHMEKTANVGVFNPSFILTNDCHEAIKDTCKALGAEWPGAPGGKLGLFGPKAHGHGDTPVSDDDNGGGDSDDGPTGGIGPGGPTGGGGSGGSGGGGACGGSDPDPPPNDLSPDDGTRPSFGGW